MEEKKEKMTLKGYYKSLSTRKTPLQTFIDDVAAKTGKSEQTVRNWCIYGIKPADFKDVRVLSQVTGIKEDDLWEE